MDMHDYWFAKYAEEDEESRKAKYLRWGRNLAFADMALSGVSMLSNAIAKAMGPNSVIWNANKRWVPEGKTYDPVKGIKGELKRVGVAAPLAYALHTLHKKYKNDPDFELKKLRPRDFLPGD